MGLARDLVELEAKLREYDDLDLFAPGGPSLHLLPECGAILPRLNASEPSSILRVCLQALRVQHDLLLPKLVDAELVATLPAETPGNARSTNGVVREMVDGARDEVILVGYEFTDSGLIGSLAAARRRNVEVVVICDRVRGAASRIRAAWPAGVPHPRLYNDRERPDGAPYASMHAKCLLVDGRNFLVTSANFTFHGLHGNVELGLRVTGVPAEEARKILAHLVDARIVEEVKA